MLFETVLASIPSSSQLNPVSDQLEPPRPLQGIAELLDADEESEPALKLEVENMQIGRPTKLPQNICDKLY